MANKQLKLNKKNFYITNNNWMILFIILAYFSFSCKCGQVATRLHYNTENSDTSLNPDNISQLEQTNSESSKDPLEAQENGTDSEAFYQDINKTLEVEGSLITSDKERSLSFIPQPAECMPEYVTVDLLPNHKKNRNSFYRPHCASTRLFRCGGCCKIDGRVCTPTKFDNITYKVKVLQYSTPEVIEVVNVQNHTECACLCANSTCNSVHHKFVETNCSCVCTNLDTRTKCIKQGHKKRWNSNTCSCKCITEHLCTTGLRFDEDTCECVKDELSGDNREDFIIKAIPIGSSN